MFSGSQNTKLTYSNYLCSVKNKLKIFSAFVLAAIYCFAISVVIQPVVLPPTSDSRSSSQVEVVSAQSEQLQAHTPQSQISVNQFSNLSAPNFKNPFIDFWAVLIVAQQQVETEFIQCTVVLTNSLFKYRKADLLYPFHYFW